MTVPFASESVACRRVVERVEVIRGNVKQVSSNYCIVPRRTTNDKADR